MRTGRGVAIGDTAAGVAAEVLTAAVLTVAAAGSTVVVTGAVRTAIRGVAASVVFAGPASGTSLELLTAGAGDAMNADEAVAALAFLRAAAVGINGALGVGVGVGGVEALAKSESADGAPRPGMFSGPVLDNCPGFAFAPPELLSDGDGR
jgi:hypothetical protein